jgi:tetratricopeptide (TPR) repeat protein
MADWLFAAALLVPCLPQAQAQTPSPQPQQAGGPLIHQDPQLLQAERLIRQEQYPAALTLLEEMAAQAAAPIEVFNNMAVVYARQGRYTLAREMLIKAVQLDPRSAALFDNLAAINGVLARQAYAKALDLSEALAGGASAPTPSLRLLTLSSPYAPQAFPREQVPPALEPLLAGLVIPLGRRDSWIVGLIVAVVLAIVSLIGLQRRHAARADHSSGRLISSTLLSSSAPAGSSAPTGVDSTIDPILPSSLSPAETRLIHVYRLIGQARLDDALAHAERLVRDFPNHRLAQLIYGDLLMAQASGQTHFEISKENWDPHQREALAQLELEAARRLHALRDAPPAGTIPRQVLAVGEHVRHLVAVDTSRSRLYLLSRERNDWKIIASRYISIGLQGADKNRSGDQKTPLGIYHIAEKIDPGKLDSIYGAGALPINYPNEYDQRLGRSGHGIWLHGVPEHDYVRAPLASNGCIVLANDDIRDITRILEPIHTPVLIAEHLEWIAPELLDTSRKTALSLIDTWYETSLGGNRAELLTLYSKQYWDGKITWTDIQTRGLMPTTALQTQKKPAHDHFTAFLWRDRYEIMITGSHEIGANGQAYLLRQFRIIEDGHWKIFFEERREL